MKCFESYSLENSLRLSSTSCREWVTVSLIDFILLWLSMYLLTVLILFWGKSEPQISSIDDSFSANVNRSSMFSVSVSHDERVVSVCKQISVCVCVCVCVCGSVVFGIICTLCVFSCPFSVAYMKDRRMSGGPGTSCFLFTPALFLI